MDLLHTLLKWSPAPWIETEDGLRLHISEDLYVYHQVREEYRFSDLGPQDQVIDIGANIGVFSLLASRRGADVLAVEPVMGRELRRNIRLNRAQNIRVLECALGNGEETAITWEGHTRRVASLTLTQIIEIAGGCTFLKVDCEGGEWNIVPEELAGIRRFEMELHRTGCRDRYLPFMEGIRRHFHVEYDPSPYPSIYGIVHGYAKNRKES
jgi:methyltransferase, FkbM family